MKKLMNQLLFVFLTVLCSANSSSVFAEAILDIVPVSLTVNLSPTGVASISYSVTNDTTQPINQLTIDPDYQSSGNESGISLQNNNCASVTLSPKASCTFQILLKGKGQPSSFFLRPRVCGYDGAICSVPTENNKVQVVLTPARFAYVTNFSGDTVSVCMVNSDGTLSTCTASNPGSTFSGPAGIKINDTGTIAYVANYYSNTISVCPINSNGTLSTCTPSNPDNVSFNGPTSFALNAQATFAYVTNYNTSTISTCTIITGGLLGTCTSSNPGSLLHGPDSIYMNAASTLIYITNSNNNTVSVCPINSSGVIGTCTSSNPGGTFHGPAGIKLNTAGTFLYVTNGGGGGGTVSLCSINLNGSLSTCSPLSSPYFVGSNFGKLAINAEDTFAYIANQYNSTIALCPINSDATFGTCTPMLLATLQDPQGINLH